MEIASPQSKWILTEGNISRNRSWIALLDSYKAVNEQAQMLMSKSKIGNISKFDSAYCLMLHYFEAQSATEVDIIAER